jgi:hypothetical protein
VGWRGGAHPERVLRRRIFLGEWRALAAPKNRWAALTIRETFGSWGDFLKSKAFFFELRLTDAEES